VAFTLHVGLGFSFCMRRNSDRKRCCAAVESSDRRCEFADIRQSLPVLPANHESWTSNHRVARRFRRPLTGSLPKSLNGRASVPASPDFLGFREMIGLARTLALPVTCAKRLGQHVLTPAALSALAAYRVSIRLHRRWVCSMSKTRGLPEVKVRQAGLCGNRYRRSD
jgi:hypothetical protein